MGQVFDAEGRVHPVTWLEAEPNVVTQIRTQENDGYSAVQLGFSARPERTTPKPQKGHLKELPLVRYIREFRGEVGDLKRGDTITLANFEEGSRVHVSGITKGKGFQGVVKRHGFAGGSRTHGQKHSEREPGSLGGGGRAGGRVAKGMSMAGRMGGERVTTRNLKVIKIIAEKNLIALEGAVPGHRGTVIEVYA